MPEGSVLEGVAEAAHRRQARRTPAGVSVHDMRKGILFEKLADDAHIYLPQVEAGGDGSNRTVFLVTTGAELVRRAAGLG